MLITARNQLLALLLAATAGVGCASSHVSTSSRSARDPFHISAQEMEKDQSRNVYDLIHAKRPFWLRDPNTRSFAMREAYEVAVYVDGTRMGGPHTLRRIMVSDIEQAQYLNAAEAMSNYGYNHSGGMILIITRRPR